MDGFWWFSVPCQTCGELVSIRKDKPCFPIRLQFCSSECRRLYALCAQYGEEPEPSTFEDWLLSELNNFEPCDWIDRDGADIQRERSRRTCNQGNPKERW